MVDRNEEAAVADRPHAAGAMLHMTRQDAAGFVRFLARMLDVLTPFAEVERRTNRRNELQCHADLVMAAPRDVTEPADLADLEERHRRFEAPAAGP